MERDNGAAAAATTREMVSPPRVNSPRQALVERLKDYGQEDVFALLDELSPDERDFLVRDIEVSSPLDSLSDSRLSVILFFNWFLILANFQNLDLPRIDRIIRCSLHSQGRFPSKCHLSLYVTCIVFSSVSCWLLGLPVAAIEPVPENWVSTVDGRTMEDREKWWKMGLKTIYEGKLGVVLLSGGQVYNYFILNLLC